MPDYITGNFALDYIDSCSEQVQERFLELQARLGIEIPETDEVLRTAQLELFMAAI